MAGSNLLQSFWNLSSLEEEERLMAAEKLLGELQVSKESESFEQELTYCTTRLISGLASNRKGARHGYFIALCEVLSLYSQYITTDSVLKLIHDKLECVGNVKASEERGAFIGQLFAFLALIQSKRHLLPMEVKTLVQKLMNLYSKKVPLRELTIRILLGLLCHLKEESEGVHILVLPYLELECGWEKCNPNNLLLLITLEEYFGTEGWYNDLIVAHWSGTGHILSRENFDRMAPVLLTSSQSHPRVHSVWPRLFKHFKETTEWGVFWSVIIEGSLLKSTRERKFLAYQLIEKNVLPTMSVVDVGVVMTPTLFHQLHTNTRAIQHSLYEASTHLLKEIVRYSLDSKELCVAVWLQLMKSGTLFPDYTSQLQSKLSCEGVASYVKYLMKGAYVISPQLLLDHVTVLIKHLPANFKQPDWLAQLAEHILVKTHLDLCCGEVGVVSLEEEKLFQLKVIQLITDLIKMSKQSTNDESSQTLWSVSMVTNIKDLLTYETYKLKIEMNSEEKEVWLESIELLNKLVEKPTECSTVFLHLMSLSSLEMIWDRETALNTTRELILCHGQMVDSTTKKTPAKKRRKSLAPPSSCPEWIEMLVDIILSLLSRPQQMWPLVIERCFSSLVPHLTVNAFQFIVKALEPQDVEDLMMTEDERQGGEEDEEEKGKKNKSKKIKKEETQEEDTERENEEDLDDKRMQFFDPNAEFLADVRNALGDVAAIDSDQESIMSIKEEQMEVLDEALSAIFKKRQEKAEQKKQKKVNQVTMLQFKMRLLHLTEFFVKYNYSNPLMLYLIKPLYLLSVSYRNHKTLSPLSNRAAPILERLCKTKKYPREGVDTALLHSFLELLLTVQLYKADKNTSPSIVSSIMFLIKVIKGVEPPPSTVPSPMATRSARKRKRIKLELSPSEIFIIHVTEWSQKALVHMISLKNSSVPHKYFEVLCQKYPEIGVNLLPSLISALGHPGNNFRLMLGYSLAVSILQRCREQLSSPNDDLVESLLSFSNLCATALLTPPTNEKKRKEGAGVGNCRPILECLECLVTLFKSLNMLSKLDLDELKSALSAESVSTSTKTQHLSSTILHLLDFSTEDI